MLRISYRPAWLVIGVWAAMTAATLAMVARCALTSPYADELRYAGVVTASEPLSWKWLWQVENQHCAPVFKLAYLGVGWATGFDFRAGAFANVALLSLLSLAMIAVAARLRGRTSELDVVFPILLLHWGHYVNLIWGFQLFYVLPTVLVAMVLLVIASSGQRLSLGLGILTAACLLAAALSGGPGVFYVPPLACWLAYAGVVSAGASSAKMGGTAGLPSSVESGDAAADGTAGLSSRGEGGAAALGRPDLARPGAAVPHGSGGRWQASLMILLAVLSCLPLVAYLTDLRATLEFPAPLQATSQGPIAGTLAFLSLGVGKVGKELWPVSGIAVLGLLAGAGCVLCRRWRLDPGERVTTAGLAMFLCGGLLLAIGIGVARGHMAPRACLQYRYMLLGAPLVLGLYFVGVRYGPAIRSRQVRLGAAAAMVALGIWYNARGWNMARGMCGPVVEMERAVAAGLSPREVAVRFADALQDPADSLTIHLEMLRKARLGPYRTGPP